MKYTDLIENTNTKYLYHATYEPYVDSIMKHGLTGNSENKNWSDSNSNVVYLAITPDIAESFAETAELADDDYDIVILQIDAQKLNGSKLIPDQNIRSNDPNENVYSYEYHGTIPREYITVYQD